jgi:DNA-binding response OmpR family regulator
MAKDKKTVLIVEDSPAQALALEHLLKTEGLRVHWAPDGQVGVALAQEHAPDVIVLDVEMPNMDGFEACQRLKANARTSRIPIVMLTVLDDAAAAMQGIDLGAIDFIPKDAFSGPVLLETLRQLHILPISRHAVHSQGGGP